MQDPVQEIDESMRDEVDERSAMDTVESVERRSTGNKLDGC